ncbi:Alpha/Beta hydrolase fold [Arabidopsis thaliana x Arabidopsis arenosa]|uniref:Alpha/Beta hydrolase fold n=1 Tax=Arabidopsis thaliana x Arabidopsis arenosa TaxID=1240361 RepID=A0A8T2AZB3_9BRAS|nr:Alpha/Beta hydrolase fold [Arabidopsis thaliana x Arabidopsis arenosa]
MHKDSESGSGSGSGSNLGQGSNYLIVRPHRGGYRDLFWYGVRDDQTSKAKFLERPDNREWSTMTIDEEAEDHRWVIVVSILVRKIIRLLRTPMELTGFVVDFFLNLFSANGGFFGLLLRLIQAKVVIPERGSVMFVSTLGQLDGRISLYKEWNFVEHLEGIDSVNSGSSGRVEIELGSRGLMDLCVMASKLAYENAKVVENVVDLHWKMNLVEFLDCWNDYQKQMSTQVFIFTDKQKDANLIVISFRGTEPFDADDWGTDFDYSWYEIPNVGKLHMGFLEAMGLGNRDDTPTFYYNLFEHISSEEVNSNKNLLDMVERSAYYAVRIILKRLLSEHENAQFVVTGHSLGGALAILFPTLLVLKEETEIMKRLLGVYTFGQPRIGNRDVGLFMKAQLNQPVDRYFRVVYCNDIVPRLPYDDKTFLYKHFGLCLFYDSFYNETKAEDEPDPNPYGLRYAILGHVIAVWELVRGLTMGYTHGRDYQEGWFRILFRLMGLVIPGLSDHCMTDYVNSVRLGPDNELQMSSL